MVEFLLIAVKLFLLLLSFGGYGLFLYHRFRVKSELLPAILFSGIGVLLFAAGILNLLPIVTILTYFCGFGLLGYSLWKYKRECAKGLFSFGFVAFLGLCCFFVLFLRTARLYAYDDFSHWGMIVRELQLYESLPNFSSETIAFPTYPPMTALIAYYVTKFAGNTESVALMGQMFFTVALSTSVFTLIPKGKNRTIPNCLALMAILLMLALFQQGVSTLLVDTILPLAALANTIVIFYYRHNMVRASVLSFPLMVATILIKNSGLFFAIANIGLLLFFLVRDMRKNKGAEKRETIRKLLFVGLSIGIALFSLVVWKSHVSMVFPPEAEIGHHAMNLENYMKNFFDKPSEQIAEINQKFLKTAFDFKTRANVILSMFSITSLLVYGVMRIIWKKSWKGILYATISTWGFYLLYLLGVYGMYLFSMPPQEASSFVSFNRYVISAVIYIVGIFLVGFLYDIAREEKAVLKQGFGILLTGIVLFAMVRIHGFEVFYKRPKYETTRVYDYDKAFRGIEINPEASYLLYIPSSKTDAHFTFFLSKYKLYTMNFQILSEVSPDLEKLILEYDHFVIVEEDATIKAYQQYVK